MKPPRLFLFDPNLKGAGGHYLGYATRVAEAAGAVGIPTVIVANVSARENLATTRKILPVLERDYWQEMCPSSGEDSHTHLSRSAELLAGSLDRVQHQEQHVHSRRVDWRPVDRRILVRGDARSSETAAESLTGTR